MGTQPAYEKRWKALVVLALSLLLISLDNTILNTALPSLRNDLGATGSELQWVVDSYLLVFAGLLLTAGSLGDRFGRKRALQLGLGIFALGSIGSALSPSIEAVTAFRAVMGVGAAFIMPSTLSIITATFPAEERGRAIGAWAAVSGLGIVLGPVSGGALLEAFDWSAVFWINVPVAVVAIVAGRHLVPESRDADARPLDPVGAFISIAGLTALVWAIIEGPEKGWTDPAILAAGGIGALVMAAFVLWERHVDHPMLDVRLFRNPRFSASSLSVSLLFAALMGTVFILTQYLQSVLAYDALEAGLALLPLGLVMIPSAAASARVTERAGTKATVTFGLATIAAALVLLSTVGTGSGYGLVAATLAVMGLGIGMTMAPATDAIMGSVPINHAGVGSAMNDTTRMVGGALGVAVLGSVLSSGYGAGIERGVEHLPAGAADAASSSIGGAAAVAAHLPGTAGDALQSVANTAFVGGMSDAALVAAAFTLAGSLIAYLWLPARERRRPAVETATAAA